MIRSHKSVLLVSILALLLGAIACGYRSETYYIERGNKLASEGKYADAALTFRKALQKHPLSGEAHYRLGLANLKTGDLVGAFRELSRAEELMPGRDDVKTSLVDVRLGVYLNDAKRPKSIYDWLTSVSKQFLAKDPNSFQGLRIKGHLAKTDGMLKEAEDAFRRAAALKPADAQVVVPLVETLFQENQSLEGERIARDFIQKRKDFALIYDLLYTHYMAQKRVAEGEGVLRLKVANNPKDVNAILQLGFFYSRLQRHTEMVDTVQRILQNPKDFPKGHLNVGEFYATIGDRGEALRQFQAGRATDSRDQATYLKKIASVQIAEAKPEEAIQSLQEILRNQPNDNESRSMRAILLVDTGKPGNVDLALSELQDLVSKNPADPLLRYSLGRAHFAKGDIDSARKELREAIKQRSDYLPPRLALLQASEKMRDYNEILRNASDILALDSNNPQARLSYVVGLIGTGSFDRARSEINSLRRRYPQSAEIELRLGLLELAEKKFKEAESVFLRLYRPGQADSRPLEGLVRVFLGQHEYGKATQMLAEELKRSPDSLEVHYLLASTATGTGQNEIAVQHYRWLSGKFPNRFEFLIGLAQAYQASNDAGNAIATFEKARELAPKDARVLAAIAFLQDVSGQRDKAKATYERALQLDPENPVILNNLAFLLADTNGNLDEAMKLVERARYKVPADPGLADTLGWVYLKKNLNDGAIQIFNNLVRKYPDSPGYRYHLGAAFFQKGDKARAKTELQIALSHAPPEDMAEKIKQLIDSSI